MKKLILLLLVISSSVVHAQKSVIFKVKFLPNKTYKMQMTTTAESLTTIENGADTFKKSNGVNTPIKSVNMQMIATSTVTNNLDKDGNIPATLSYDKFESKANINGKLIQRSNPLLGLKIKGKYNQDAQLQVDTVIGVKLSVEQNKILEVVLKSMQSAIKFPTTPMKIGDVFKSSVPMKIPMQGMPPISINIVSSYILKEIKGDKAFFDMDLSVEYNMKQSKLEMSAIGNGTGKVEFDIKKSIISKFTSNLPVDMTIKANDKFTMKVLMKTTSVQNVTMQ